MSANRLNPISKFPKPPFPEQHQNARWLVLVSKSQPRPDHGESSYVGAGRLQGRKALITGGDSGMGRAAAIAYAREGADVAINFHPDEQSDANESNRTEFARAGSEEACSHAGDIRGESFTARRLVARRARLACAVSASQSSTTLDASKPTIRFSVFLLKLFCRHSGNQHLCASFWIIKAALPHLVPGACIVATTSEQAYDPSPDLYDYAQTKAATMNFVKSLAKQLAPRGIRVNGVAPGPVWTPLQVSGGASAEKQKSFGAHTPFGLPGMPAELAGVHVLLADNQAKLRHREQIYADRPEAPDSRSFDPKAALKRNRSGALRLAARMGRRPGRIETSLGAYVGIAAGDLRIPIFGFFAIRCRREGPAAP